MIILSAYGGTWYPPSADASVRHANLLCKNSDKNLTSLQEFKIFSVSPSFDTSTGSVSSRARSRDDKTQDGVLSEVEVRHKVSEFLTSASGWDTKVPPATRKKQ